MTRYKGSFALVMAMLLAMAVTVFATNANAEVPIGKPIQLSGKTVTVMIQVPIPGLSNQMGGSGVNGLLVLIEPVKPGNVKYEVTAVVKTQTKDNVIVKGESIAYPGLTKTFVLLQTDSAVVGNPYDAMITEVRTEPLKE